MTDEEFKQLEKRVKELEDILMVRKKTIPIKRELSINEFLLSKNPKSDIEKTLMIAYFLEKYENMKIFNVRDIEDGFLRAKEKIPDNTNDKINQNIRRAFLMDVPEKKDGLKSWKLTNTGIEYIESL